MDIAQQSVVLQAIADRAKTIDVLLNGLSVANFDKDTLVSSYEFIINVLRQWPNEKINLEQFRGVCSNIFNGERENMMKQISMSSKIKEETKKEEIKSVEKVSKPIKRSRSSVKKTETSKKRKSSPEKKESVPVKPKKKNIDKNESCFSTENLLKIQEDIRNDVTITSKSDKNTTKTESWKNVYYRNYDMGQEIASNYGGSNGIVEIYYDDRQTQLILNCSYDKKGTSCNHYVVLDDTDNIVSLKASKEVKNGMYVMLELIKETGFVRELCQDDAIFGVTNKIIQVHN